MTPLPPLTEKIAPGAAGGHEFERLLHQLLLRHADRHGFLYEPTSGAGGDRGIDGLAPDGGVPGLDGPVAFQFKWLFADLHKGHKARNVKDALERAQRHDAIRHWILVTPWDLKPSERQWLDALPVRAGLRLHHWGQTRIEHLFEHSRALFARYYPEPAREYLEDYDGFEFPAFARSYCEKVVLAHRRLRTLGLPPETLRERDALSEIRLRDVFVPLKVVAEGDREPRAWPSSSGDGNRPSSWGIPAPASRRS